MEVNLRSVYYKAHTQGRPQAQALLWHAIVPHRVSLPKFVFKCARVFLLRLTYRSSDSIFHHRP